MAIDPYIGYGGAEADRDLFKARVSGFRNMNHLQMTSGEAARSGRVVEASLVFIDAVHDYANALFDGWTWGGKLVSGGLLAFHDTDSLSFAGVQKAVWDLLHLPGGTFSLFLHVNGLVVLKRA
jgi:hypothetical protein